MRLRTTKTSTNGMPSLASKPKSLGTDWTHVVYTFDGAGKAKLYLNGTWQTAEPREVGLAEEQLAMAREYALTGGGSGYITRGGKLVMAWGDLKTRYDLKSTTKSFGATALGVAILDGKIALKDKVTRHHPGFGTPPAGNSDTGWLDKITILHLATHTAGFEKPGGYEKLSFEPGTKWAYSDGGPNWLAECVTLAYRQDLDKLMFERVFTPLGITRADLVWRNNSYRAKEIDGIPRREFGSGISANVDAMARIGLLYLRGGMWNGKRILPDDFVKQASTTVPAVVGLSEVDPKNYGNASDHYGLLWWNNADGTLEDVPRDTFWSWGLYDSLIVVIPSLDIVVSRAGQSWKREWAGHYDVLRAFLGPIVAAAKSRSGTPARLESDGKPPYPPSPVITGIDWAPASSIIRKARGGDNWPLTWADDDHLYTAYGDGRGFEPLIDVNSHDNDSAYKPADRMVLARVPAHRIRERDAYEFLAGLNDAGRPEWSADIAKRAAVFTHPGRCYRSGISYNTALKRYLWCQTIPGGVGDPRRAQAVDDPRRARGGDPRFQGGFAIYDAPQPWGPWTTVYFTEAWDVGPGETSCLPTKWIRNDGRTIHLVFSGDDCFSVRKATLRLRDR